ncbi:hypothetical protein NQD34_013862 [Periophthalmus magnuspinnatus]|nr:hypothetical protein NQD34_013862 [Periophthalmus magnuspinnatus]
MTLTFQPKINIINTNKSHTHTHTHRHTHTHTDTHTHTQTPTHTHTLVQLTCPNNRFEQLHLEWSSPLCGWSCCGVNDGGGLDSADLMMFFCVFFGEKSGSVLMLHNRLTHHCLFTVCTLNYDKGPMFLQ